MVHTTSVDKVQGRIYDPHTTDNRQPSLLFGHDHILHSLNTPGTPRRLRTMQLPAPRAVHKKKTFRPQTCVVGDRTLRNKRSETTAVAPERIEMTANPTPDNDHQTKTPLYGTLKTTLKILYSGRVTRLTY